jgi:hypothetical protein
LAPSESDEFIVTLRDNYSIISPSFQRSPSERSGNASAFQRGVLERGKILFFSPR